MHKVPLVRKVLPEQLARKVPQAQPELKVLKVLPVPLVLPGLRGLLELPPQ